MKNHTLRAIAARMDAAKDFTVFVVGDSITEGARATDAEHTYTAVFARGLAERYGDRTVIRYDGRRYPTPDAELRPLMTSGEPVTVQEGQSGRLTVVRSGIGGNTARRILTRRRDFTKTEPCGRSADLYIMMMGINDALTSDPAKYVSPHGFAEDLCRLAEVLSKENPDADVIWMTPTYNDYGVERVSRLDAHAEQMLAVAREYGIPVIDQHRLWMEHLTVGEANYGQGDWLSGVEGDKCHPGDRGHAVIAQAILDELFGE